MAVFAVGDIQGCYDPLRRLLDKAKFDPTKDRLVCVGDLVNRGPKSLETLDFLMSLGDSCEVVLGNHDIHFLAMANGIRQPKPSDTLQPLLESPDLDHYTHWLRHQPLVRIDDVRKIIFCHAGVYPWWDIKMLCERANEVESILKKPKKSVSLLKKIYSNQPSKWSEDLGPTAKIRFTINSLTRMRFVSPKGHLNFSESGFTGKSRLNRLPWFELENPGTKGYKVVFGHWSALGLVNRPDILSLDTGCVWGRELTMAKLPKNPSKKTKLYQAS